MIPPVNNFFLRKTKKNLIFPVGEGSEAMERLVLNGVS